MIITDYLPTLIFYTLIYSIACLACFRLGKKSFVISIAITALILIMLPFLMNFNILKKYNNLQEQYKNIEISKPISSGETITIDINEHFDKSNASCLELCEKLLINKIFKNVVIRSSKNDRSISFSLKNTEECNTGNDKGISAICLKREVSNSFETDYLYKITKLYYPEEYAEKKAIAASIEMSLLQLIDQRNNNDLVVHQKSEYDVRIFKTPLQLPSNPGIHKNIFGKYNLAAWFLRYSFARDKLKKNLNKENIKIFSSKID